MQFPSCWHAQVSKEPPGIRLQSCKSGSHLSLPHASLLCSLSEDFWTDHIFRFFVPWLPLEIDYWGALAGCEGQEVKGSQGSYSWDISMSSPLKLSMIFQSRPQFLRRQLFLITAASSCPLGPGLVTTLLFLVLGTTCVLLCSTILYN